MIAPPPPPPPYPAPSPLPQVAREQPLDVVTGASPDIADAWPGSIDTLPLIPANPAATGVVRLSAALSLAPLLVGIVAIDWFVIRPSFVWWGLPSVLGAVLFVMLAFVLPARWVASLGHAVDGDELRVVRGNISRSDTVVPLSRVQHIDVDQGPLQRRAGLATVVVHTAGTSATLVPVAHLPHADAVALRDRIRARIALKG